MFVIMSMLIISSPLTLPIVIHSFLAKRIVRKRYLWLLMAFGFVLGVILVLLLLLVLMSFKHLFS